MKNRSINTVLGAAAAITASALVFAGAPASALQTGLETAPTVSTKRYEVTLTPAVPAGALQVLLADRTLDVLELRHSGATSGLLLMGEHPLQNLDMYIETNEEVFGEEPMVSSLIVASATEPAIAIAGSSASTEVVEEITSELTAALRADSLAASSGEVTSASTSNSWAPRDGTVRNTNHTSGFPRRMTHRYQWNSRAGLDSYNDYAYEHDYKLKDAGAGGTRPACSNDDFWAIRSNGVMLSTNMPESAGVYIDTDVSDGCDTMDMTWGLFKPGKLAVNTYYTTIVSAVKGNASTSPFALSGQKLSNDCQFLPDSAACIGLNTDREGTGSQLFVGPTKGVAPGCFSWLRGESSTKYAC